MKNIKKIKINIIYIIENKINDILFFILLSLILN